MKCYRSECPLRMFNKRKDIKLYKFSHESECQKKETGQRYKLTPMATPFTLSANRGHRFHRLRGPWTYARWSCRLVP